jgi:hypothetical protein
MALKKILSQEDYNKLDDVTKILYNKKEDDKFHLDLEQDDAAELRRAKEHEVEARKKAEADLAAAQAALKAFTDAEDAAKQKKEANKDDAARKAGDIETLEASWQAKFDKLQADSDLRLKNLQNAYTADVVDARAKTLASSVSEAPDLLLPHIRSRFSVDFEGDAPAVRILDGDGKISALTPEDLQKEVVNDKRYAAIITGSKASGGGAKGGEGGGAAKEFAKMNPNERKTLRDENPGEYDRQIAAERAAPSTLNI